MFKATVFTLAMLSSVASAETLTCPVGGERFAAPDSPVCGEITGYTMLFQPIGCAPGLIPQCPQNFLPMYRDFSAEELPLLAQYMQTESYESAVDFSRYLLAYNIEKYLNGQNPKRALLLLIEGLWHEPSLLFDDPYYLLALTAESESASRNERMNGKDNAALLSFLSFIKLLLNEREAAREYFDRIELNPHRFEDIQAYVSAVSLCLEDQTRPHCRALAPIPAR